MRRIGKLILHKHIVSVSGSVCWHVLEKSVVSNFLVPLSLSEPKHFVRPPHFCYYSHMHTKFFSLLISLMDFIYFLQL